MSEIELAGQKLPEKLERKIVLIGSVIGVIAFIYIYLKSKNSTTTTSPIVEGSMGSPTTSTTPTAPNGTTSPSTTTPESVEFKFATDTSNLFADNIGTTEAGNFNYSNATDTASTGSGGGGGLLQLPFFSLGGSGSKSYANQNVNQYGTASSWNNSTSTSVNGSNSNVFNSDVIVQNADAPTIASVEAFLLSLAGTQAQRSQESIAETSNIAANK